MPGSRTLTLVCFPHAGGGLARYRKWREHLPAGVELVLPVLPGRERRLFDEPLADVASVCEYLLDDLAATIAGSDDLAIAGLSYGALVAFDLAARLQASGKPVRAVFAASQRAPTRLPPQASWHLMDDDRLLAELRTTDGMDGLSPDLGGEEFRELFLPVLRADLHASESYLKPATHDRLRCPIFVYHGTEDDSVPLSSASAWREETEHLRWRDIAADHFLLGPDGEDLWFQALRRDLASCLERDGLGRAPVVLVNDS